MLLAMGMVGGCSDAPPSPDGYAFSDLEVLEIDPEPVLSIGTLDGEPEQQFEAIRRVMLTEDATLAILDSGTRSVRYFDLDGSAVGQAGGLGEGPGEIGFVSDSWLDAAGGIAVVDPSLGRITLYRADGTYQDLERPIDPSGPMEAMLVKGRLHETWFLLLGELFEPPPSGEMLQAFDRVQMLRGESFEDGDGVELPSVHWYTTRVGRSLRLPVALSPLPSVQVNRDVVAVLDPANARVLTPAPDSGWTETALPERCPRIPEAYLHDTEEGEALRSEVLLNEFRTLIPECLPGYDQLAVTGDGRIWVRLTRDGEADPEEARRWIVLDGPGGATYAAHLPARFIPMDAGDGIVYGRWQDDFDVHYLRAYRFGDVTR
jgi:hypothetical protein